MAYLRETEYDPFTGETSRWYFDGDKIIHHKTVDLSPLLEQCKREAAAFDSFNSNSKMHKMASIPPIVIDKILKDHDIDVFSDNPADIVKVARIIETEYPALKTHSKKIWRPHGA